MSKITLRVIIAITFLSLILLPFLFKKNKHQESQISIPDNSFSNYIAAFTSGIISNESTIRIDFVNEIKDIKPGQEASDELLQFSPSISGHAIWLNNRSIEFKPDERLPSNTEYKAELMLSKIIKDLPEINKSFVFNFKTIPQWFDVSISEIKTIDKKTLRWQRITGAVTMADAISPGTVAQFISANQNNKALKIKWSEENINHVFYFTIDSVSRTEKASEVLLKWDGKPANLDIKGQRIIEVPSLSDFKILDVSVTQSPEQFVLIQFSDPVDESQNFDGLITIDGITNSSSAKELKYVAEDNVIKVFPANRISGLKNIHIFQGLKNCLGYSIKSDFNLELVFEELKPQIKMSANGVILPTSKNMSFPFKAVNLKAVDIRITKIFENNITQFLQQNSLEGENELYRVGKTIYKGSLSLQAQLGKNEIGKWNNFSIDLSKLIKAESGAIYRITLSFKKAYSAYECNGEVYEEDPEIRQFNYDEYQEDNWDQNDYYYDYEDMGEYDYSQRDNPCHPMYYRYTSQSQNILASDIGLIAKKTNEGKLICIANNILTTKPLSSIEIELYNFQQQIIETQKTNNDGICTFKLSDKPFLLVAKNGAQRAYLKLDDGASLSLSMFDVAGESVQKGLKGFIFGERGVWRPGDSIFISFILQDKLKSLPPDHPVTFELYNPMQQLYKKIVRTTSLDGFYNFQVATDANAPTGNWYAKIKVGGVLFEKQIKIETIMPNRLKINLDLGSNKTQFSSSSLAKLTANWLTGAPARDLNSKVELLLDYSKTNFKNYEGYNFDDPTLSINGELQTVFESKLDNQGQATFKPEININGNAPGVLTAYFIIRVFEEGGNASIDRFNVPYYPFKSYAGIKVPISKDNWSRTLAADTTHIIQLANVDVNGKPLSNKLKVQVFKINWRWWWQSYSNEIANYLGDNYHQPVSTQTISTVNGNAQLKFKIDQANWGRYYIRVTDLSSGHCTGETVYVDYWSGDNGDGIVRQGNEGVNLLSFTSDKTKYLVGEEMKITLPAANQGRAFITIENGTKILSSQWLETVKGQNTIRIKVSEDMAPNAFVSIHYLQAHAQTINDLPIRLYGVLPIQVENPNTHLHPIITSTNEWKPEEKAMVSVSEKDGKEMVYNIAIVDEGLLDLTRFKTPDPWNHFYSKEGLGVKTWDLYDKVIGAYSGEIQKILSIGGDGSINQKVGDKANRFKPMVKFLGPFKLSKGQKQQHEFMMPQYVGSVRVMVVAENNNAFGNAEKTIPVRKPLMVLGTMPRVVAPGESVLLPITVFAMAKHIKNVTVTVSTNDVFSIEEESLKSLNFNQIGDQVINFKLKVNSKIGVGKVKISAKCGAEFANYDFEIESRNPNPKITKVLESTIEAGKAWNKDFALFGSKGTNKVTLELSTFPPINLGHRLSYLISYPHGCIEQTSSSVFPQLFLNEIVELNSEKKVQINNHIRYAIDKIKSFQTMSGGFAYWSGERTPDEWGSSYAGHFLLEAELKGYFIPPGILENWKRFQKLKAINWSPYYSNGMVYEGDYLNQAYRLYTLALAKSPELGAMNRLKEIKTLSLAAKWRLAAAYALAGQIDVARALVNGLPQSVPNYNEMYYTFGSDERDQAMILETLVLLNEKTKCNAVAKIICQNLSSEYWYSTQTTAYSLIAISKYIKFLGSVSKTMSFNYVYNKTESQKINTVLSLKQIDLDANGGLPGKTISLVNTSQGVLFARIILEGTPETDNSPAVMNNLSMNVNYYKMDGTGLDITKIEQGTDFIAQVSIYNPATRNEYKQMALSQIFPSGWEIRNTRMEEKDNITKSSYPTYQDIRDDRVYTYFDLYPGETKKFNLILNASYIGKFYMPATYCEAMYDNTINAKDNCKWVEVIKVKSN